MHIWFLHPLFQIYQAIKVSSKLQRWTSTLMIYIQSISFFKPSLITKSLMWYGILNTGKDRFLTLIYFLINVILFPVCNSYINIQLGQYFFRYNSLIAYPFFKTYAKQNNSAYNEVIFNTCCICQHKVTFSTFEINFSSAPQMTFEYWMW